MAALLGHRDPWARKVIQKLFQRSFSLSLWERVGERALASSNLRPDLFFRGLMRLSPSPQPSPKGRGSLVRSGVRGDPFVPANSFSLFVLM